MAFWHSGTDKTRDAFPDNQRIMSRGYVMVDFKLISFDSILAVYYSDVIIECHTDH